MSDDQLDNDLTNRIKQVFDSYQDDTAQEGWLLLREKYPEKKKERAILWWRMAGVAAFLLVALNIFLWYKTDKTYQKKISTIQKTEHIDSVEMNVDDTKFNQRYLSIIKKPATVLPRGYNAAVIHTNITAAAIKPATKSYTNQSTATQNKQPTFLADSLPATQQLSSATLPNGAELPLASNKGKATIEDKTPIAAKTGNITNQQQSVVVSKAMQDLFNKEDKNKRNINVQQTTVSKVAFGIYAATYVNYAKGSQRQFNNGAGISSDIKLTDNLSISTGISIGQNSLAYNSPTPSLQVAMAATNSKNFQANANLLPLVIPASKNLNASLVNLDIPVNLKYNFNPQKSNTYIAAGLSSGTFINESYNTTYNYTAPDNNRTLQLQDASHKSFDNFYFAQMLNLAFGVGYSIGKNQLVIEPFVKYPLNGLGDQHILFGSEGLNLKFNFDPGTRHEK